LSFDGELSTVADFEHYCRQITPPATYEFLYGEYGDPNWSTYTSNRAALNALKLRPRVLTGIGEPRLATDVLAESLSMPVVIGPTASLGDLDPDAELGTVRAAGAAGTLFVLSSFSSVPAADVARAATGPWWQQVFVYRDRALTEWQVRSAVELGAGAIVLTVSNAGEMWHHQTVRFPSVSAAKPRLASNLVAYDGASVPDYVEYKNLIDPAVGWADVDWLRSLSDLPLVVKGIQTLEDARLCLEHGVDAIVVSNHGGRFVQGARGSIEALPEIAEAVGSQVEVYVDGGIRQGQDVLKALALGAKAVWTGRATRWAQAARGEAGVERVLEILREELRGTMALCGVADVRAVDSSLVTATSLPTLEN
jgi:4-hydroxymandelate oxidase